MRNNLHLDYKRLILLGVTSIIMCVSNILSILAPFPLALATILYGRQKGFALSLAGMVFCFLLTLVDTRFQATAYIFIFTSLIGAVIAEMITRNISPMKIIVSVGTTIILLVSLLVNSYLSTKEMTLKEVIVEEITKIEDQFKPNSEDIKKQLPELSSEQLKSIALLENPDLLADEMLKLIPSFFGGVFIFLWVNTFLVLRSNRVIRRIGNKDYVGNSLSNFKMPEYFVWPVIALIAIAIWGENLGPQYVSWATTALFTLAVFYFFQGFGIYLSFLDAMKTRGFIRTLFVVLTVLLANQILVVVGLLDMFVNFRKFFNKKSNEN